MRQPQRGPLICAGLLMGAGLGGFADGIVLHQILQWHHMLSTRLPPDTLVNIKVNMFWDGIFHAAVWLMTVMGLACLWRAGRRREVPWSGRTFTGSLMAGWGMFNIVEGLIDHHWLRLHHVNEIAAHSTFWDAMFLMLGIALLLGGWLFIVNGGRRTARGAR